jgi:uncharacterized membrane protein
VVLFALRVVLGVVFLFLLPGYALMGVFFPRRDEIDSLERLGLGVGVSIAVIASIAAFLNYSPWGIQLGSVVVSVSLFILLASLASWYRLNKLSPEDRFLNELSVSLGGTRSLSGLNVLGSALLLTLLVALFGVGAYLGTALEIEENFTQFYVLGSSGKADAYPQEVAPGEPITLTLGVANHEHRVVRYHIVQKVDDEEIFLVATLQLGYGEKREQPYTFTMTKPGENRRVTFLLYKENDQAPYRSLHLWITVKDEVFAQ